MAHLLSTAGVELERTGGTVASTVRNTSLSRWWWALPWLQWLVSSQWRLGSSSSWRGRSGSSMMGRTQRILCGEPQLRFEKLKEIAYIIESTLTFTFDIITLQAWWESSHFRGCDQVQPDVWEWPGHRPVLPSLWRQGPPVLPQLWLYCIPECLQRSEQRGVTTHLPKHNADKRGEW